MAIRATRQLGCQEGSASDFNDDRAIQGRPAPGMAAMSSQKEIFRASEADAWFNRNRGLVCGGTPQRSEVVDLLRGVGIAPKKVLEIGCGNGVRLEQIREAFHCACFGIDPSTEAVRDGKTRFPALSLTTGTADCLDFKNDAFDTIFFGFCLYLCDRADLFKIAYEADRCLEDKGTLIITDFSPGFPYRNTYAHHDNIYSYKMDYAKMFSWNPGYSETARIVHGHSGSADLNSADNRVGTIVLRKNGACAYPTDPYRATRGPTP